MTQVKNLPNVVGLLGDIVNSRTSDRARTHRELLAALDPINATVPHLEPLRVTVGDEVQGVYATLGDALFATTLLRDLLFGTSELRFGLGGGNVGIIDADRGIQDGSAWSLAREAIDFVEELSRQSGYSGVRTAIRDERPAAVQSTDALVRLVDTHLAALRAGTRRSLIGLLAGRDNAEVATAEKISASANTQRVQNNGLRPLADAIRALHTLP